MNAPNLGGQDNRENVHSSVAKGLGEIPIGATFLMKDAQMRNGNGGVVIGGLKLGVKKKRRWNASNIVPTRSVYIKKQWLRLSGKTNRNKANLKRMRVGRRREMSDPNYAHQFLPNRGGLCKLIVSGSHCGLSEDVAVHRRHADIEHDGRGMADSENFPHEPEVIGSESRIYRQKDVDAAEKRGRSEVLAACMEALKDGVPIGAGHGVGYIYNVLSNLHPAAKDLEALLREAEVKVRRDIKLWIDERVSKPKGFVHIEFYALNETRIAELEKARATSGGQK